MKKRAPAVNPNCRLLFQIARTAADRTVDDLPDRASRSDGDSLVAIVFAFSAMEAFFNELPEVIESLHETSLANIFMPNAMLGLASCLGECERESAQMPLKLAVWHVALGKKFDRSEFEDLLLLRDVRNALVHYHGEVAMQSETLGEFPHPFDLEGRDRKLIKRLRAKKVLPDVKNVERYPLLELLRTRSMAIWAVNTADKSVFTLLRQLPAEGDLLDFMTTLFAFMRVEKNDVWVRALTTLISKLVRAGADLHNPPRPASP
jgi:hypothetical protein